MEAAARAGKLGLIVRFGFFAFLVILGQSVYAIVLSAAGYLIAASGSTFGAGVTANALCVRIFERGSLAMVGLGWRPGSARNALYGFGAGALGAVAVTLIPLALGLAWLERDTEHPGSLAGFLFVSVLLLLGAIGEELLFRGYGFQVLVPGFGLVAALAVSSLFFGLLHLMNLHASAFGIVNTIGFGVVLGYAVIRSGDLWAAIGIHFGWNWVLPLAGVTISGFKISMTGYTLRWRVSDLWSGGAYGPEAGVLTTGVIVALLVFLRGAPLARFDAPLLAQRNREA